MPLPPQTSFLKHSQTECKLLHRVFVVDAFATAPFSGNPAAVLVLAQWPPAYLMEQIASQFNISETAFVVPEADHHAIRWFSPTHEVDVCGHATIAAAHVLCTEHRKGPRITFSSRIGKLTVRKTSSSYALEMPLIPYGRPALRFDATVPEALEHFTTFENVFAVMQDYDAVRNYAPDFARFSTLHPYGVVVTAHGKDEDFVSRYFAPSYGIPEDPITGSIHATLAPYWGALLGKSVMVARQLSRRGGRLYCAVRQDTVVVLGAARTFLRGTIDI